MIYIGVTADTNKKSSFKEGSQGDSGIPHSAGAESKGNSFNGKLVASGLYLLKYIL